METNLETKFAVAIDFQAILNLILQLPKEYKDIVKKALQEEIVIQTDEKTVGYLKGTLNISQYQTNISKNWEGVEGALMVEEPIEEILQTLKKMG